jgi:hypothetical protein
MRLDNFTMSLTLHTAAALLESIGIAQDPKT